MFLLLKITIMYLKAFGPFVIDAISPRLPMSYTQEEENWLQHHLDHHAKAEMAISFGTKVINNYIRLARVRPKSTKNRIKPTNICKY